MSALACPCGSTRLRSDEVAAIGYPVVLTRGDGGEVEVTYTGDEYEVFDEGTEYAADIWCRDCGSNLNEDDLVDPEKACWECEEDGNGLVAGTHADDNGSLCEGCYDRRVEDGLIEAPAAKPALFEVVAETTVEALLAPVGCTEPCDGTGYTGKPGVRCTTHYEPNDLSEFKW